LNALLALAQSEAEISIAAEQLDADNWRLTCRNGLLDLRTGTLAAHDRAALCTKRVEADYRAQATCPTWLAFLDTIFAGDGELIAYLQRAVGYSLTGDTSEQCLFVLHGTGANGKSTFIETLTAILAEYGATTPTETLMVKHGDSIPSDVARLVGARFVAASESGDGRRLDEELVKRITGGDRMTARFMHRDWFQFTPVLKLWLAVNHEPTIRGTDHGIWRRIHLVPFAVTIPDERQDKGLKAKLLSERAGILAWAAQGCLTWQREGLRPPAKVVAATKAYRARMDNIGQFIGQMTVKTPTATTSARRLYGAYEAWCQESSEVLANQTRFGRYLGDHGFNKQRTMRGVEWIGIGLLAPVEEPAPDPDGLFA
jgi:putative DNA primase/helicase